jgi:hypothetical protein
MSDDTDLLPAQVSGNPKSRASNPKAALTRITKRKLELDRRLPIYQAVEAAYDREPTDSREALQLDGLGWTCTVDWGGMKAGVDQGVYIDYNLATQPDTYIKLVPKEDRVQGLCARLEMIEREDKELLDGWSGWLPELEMMLHNRRAHGLGIFHFPHPVGWHFRSVHPASLIYPSGAKIHVNEWEWFALRTEWRITDLLRRLETPAESAAVGWDLEVIRKCIKKLEGGETFLRGMYQDPEKYAVDLRSADLDFASNNSSVIPGYAFYVREWDGRVSEHFVTEDDELGYLFSGIGRHESMDSCLCLFPLSMGQGYMERVRGYGVEMLPFHDTENRARNHLMDQVFISGVVLKSAEGDDTRQAMRGIRHHGPFLLMDSTVDLVKDQLPDTTTASVRVLGEMERARSQSNQALGGADHSQRASGMSATQSRILFQENQGAQSIEVARFYQQLGAFHRKRFDRIHYSKIEAHHPGGKEALEMMELMLAKGVQPADFDNIRSVKPRTIFGDGNPVNQWLALQDVAQWYGTFTADGKKMFVQHVVAARLRDPDLARALTGADGRVDQRGLEQRWAAQMENNVFETSDTRQDMGADDDHVVHLAVHTDYAEEVLKRQLSEEDQFGRISRAQAHVAMHLEWLAQDQNSVAEFKEFNQRWARLVNWLRQMGQHLEAKQAQAQEQELQNLRQPEPSVKEKEVMLTENLRRQLALSEAEAEERRKEEKHRAELRRAAEKTVAGKPTPKPMAAFDELGRLIQ